MQNKGIIKWFNPSKGYGFICSEEVQDDVFVHLSVLKGQKIYEGDTVVFEANKCDKGFRALVVEKVDA